MPVFNVFVKIVNRNKFVILLYLIIFSAFLVLYSSMQTETETAYYADAALDITVIDRDETTLSQALETYLGARHNLVPLADDTETLQDELFYRNVRYILIIPDGFQSKVLDGGTESLLENVKVPGSVAGVYVDGQIERYLKTLGAYLAAGFETEDAVADTAAVMAAETTVEMARIETESGSNVTTFFNFMAYVFIAVLISAIGPIFITFNRTDLKRRMDASALSLSQKNLQIALGTVILSIILWAVLMVIAGCFSGQDMFSSAGRLRIVNSFVFMTVCTALAFLIGQFAEKLASLAMISNILGLGMSFLCGAFVPQAFLSDGILAVSRFLPAYWYISLNERLSGVETVGAGQMEAFVQCIGVQLLFAAVFMAAAMVVSRQKRRASAA